MKCEPKRAKQTRKQGKNLVVSEKLPTFAIANETCAP